MTPFEENLALNDFEYRMSYAPFASHSIPFFGMRQICPHQFQAPLILFPQVHGLEIERLPVFGWK
jgi:hypothetical protein